jgi:hypothetical protein
MAWADGLKAGALLLPVLLAGCDTVGFGQGAAPAPALKAIDYRQDDLAGSIFVLDLPSGLQPVMGGTTATFDVKVPGSPPRNINSTLSFADGDAIDTALPPPAAGHTYFLLGFPTRDKGTVQQAQRLLALATPENSTVAFAVSPKFCETAAVDPAAAVFSILPVVPAGGQRAPLVANATILSLIGAGQLPPCGSH